MRGADPAQGRFLKSAPKRSGTTKFGKPGRHGVPWQLPKAAKRAGLAVAAAAALGALVATPLLLGSTTPSAAAGQAAAARLARPGQTARITGRHSVPASIKGTGGKTGSGKNASPGGGAKGQQRTAAGTGSQGVRCSGPASGPMLPANYAAIVGFLTAHGYTGNAAAGIAGNIFMESMGNPESIGSGGGGLIGWTPLPAGYVTGNQAADLKTQLAAILTFNQLWAQYIPMLNAATTPSQAAYIYVTYFERAGLPALGNRQAAASAVAAACGI